MIRLLLILFVIGLAAYALRILLQKPARRNSTGARQKGETMIACDYCRLHVPRSEAVFAQGRRFCSEAHHRAWLNGTEH